MHKDIIIVGLNHCSAPTEVRESVAFEGTYVDGALAHADAAFKQVVGDEIVLYPVAAEVRREAGFTEEEIGFARKQAKAS